MSHYRHPIERIFIKTLIGFDFERVGHQTGSVRDHAVCGDDRIAFDPKGSPHRLLLRFTRVAPDKHGLRAERLHRLDHARWPKPKRPGMGLARLRGSRRLRRNLAWGITVPARPWGS